MAIGVVAVAGRYLGRVDATDQEELTGKSSRKGYLSDKLMNHLQYSLGTL
jgi:hypothetical protein